MKRRKNEKEKRAKCTFRKRKIRRQEAIYVALRLRAQKCQVIEWLQSPLILPVQSYAQVLTAIRQSDGKRVRIPIDALIQLEVSSARIHTVHSYSQYNSRVT